MVFCRLPGPKTSVVTLVNFPNGADGQAFSVLTGAPPQVTATGTVRNRSAECQLIPGVYFVKVQGPLLEKGFEVPGGSDVRIDLAA
jgi:hypothetical protein